MTRPEAKVRIDAGRTAIANKLAELKSMTRGQLKAEWRSIYGAPPPPWLSHDLLLRAVAYRLQAKVLGGLDSRVRRRLEALATELEETGTITLAARLRIKPGTRLIRSWQGETHAVTALEDGFAYRGERYGSLSEIARVITGTRWSGPAFFGLKPPTRKDVSAGEVRDG